jgi:DNA processing protein
MKITPREDYYPRRLLHLDLPPTITTSGSVDPHAMCVAIVGSRRADSKACDWAHQLAYHLARAGIVVVSGGAVGIDSAAHRGAMRGGTTWCVLPNGRGADYPAVNAHLFREIEESETSRLIWPFSDGRAKTDKTPHFRNGVLVALASIVIVIQAGLKSGSLNSARWAVYLNRQLYVATGRPWEWEFQFSQSILESGQALPLFTIEQLFRSLGLRKPNVKDPRARIRAQVPQQLAIRHIKKRDLEATKVAQDVANDVVLSPSEIQVFSVVLDAPTQQEEIIDRAGLPASTTVSALLTLSLRDVVVEGPDGFFRRRSQP